MSDEKNEKKETKDEVKIPIKEIATAVVGIVANKKVQKMVLGEYSDGKTRNLPDAISGEILSPKQKEKYKNKKNKNKKKKFKYN